MTQTRIGALTLVWVCLLGCGDDGSMGAEDASADTVASMCAADTDCDDGLYCNGAERCDPSATTAGADDCVMGQSPCPPGECDEAGRTCTTDCGTADSDGDGHDSLGCGGDDCDDRDARRFPGNLEVCDAEGLDDDCNPETLGRDVDEDGFIPDRCCNLQTDGSLACGDDCDDSRATVNPSAVDSCNGVDDDCNGIVDDAMLDCVPDTDGDGFGTGVTQQVCVAMEGGCPSGFAAPGGEPDCDDEDGGVYPGAAEICNGEDDNCDGAADETFDCVQSVSATGTNHCGRTGTRQCSGSCEWVDPDFIANENAGTCDYCCDECDVDGQGISEETAIATAMSTTLIDSGATRYGNMLEFSGALYLNSGGNHGTAFRGPLVVGHGPVVVDVEASIIVPGSGTVDYGWAIMMLPGSSGFVGSGGDSLGVPRQVDGVAAEWRFYQEGNAGTASDSVVFRRLSAAGADPVLGRDNSVAPDATGGLPGPIQRMRMRITPDTVGTPADETEILAEYDHTTVQWQPIGGCANAGANPCGFTVTPGDSYYFGYGGAAGTASIFWDDTTPSVVVSGLCP